MEVHMGKYHYDRYVCGLCEYKSDNLENLEMHLSKCETFECYNCDEIKLKSLCDLKVHSKQGT
jgi:hypothetical protein